MACISKLEGGFEYDCHTGATGLQSAIIINKEDIASFTVAPYSGAGRALALTALTLAASAKAYKIDTPKRVLVTSESLKVNEGAPNMYNHSVTLTATGEQNAAFIQKFQGVPNGSFVVLARGTNLKNRVFGLYYGLSATSVERSSADNGGWVSLTLETPEQFIGEDFLGLSDELYTSLYNAAVY